MTSTTTTERKKPKNDAVRMHGNDFSPERQILQLEDLSCSVVAATGL